MTHDLISRPLPHTAMILAAGKGTRLQPLTLSLPKPLICVGKKPLIAYGIEALHALNIPRIVVNVHYKADLLEEYLKPIKGSEILISDERHQLLETGGGIKKALPLLGSDPFFVLNADSFWIEPVSSNLVRLSQAWDPDQMDGLLLLATARSSFGYDGPGDFFSCEPSGSEPFALQRRQRQQLHAPFIYTGVALLAPHIFEGTPEGPFSLNRVFDSLIEKSRLHGLSIEGTWLHVGTVANRDRAEAYLKTTKLKRLKASGHIPSLGRKTKDDPE
jgi:MurNAc alpha-1-phosphate uridylyltransferase